MSELAEMAQKFVIPASVAGAGAVAAVAIILRGTRSTENVRDGAHRTTGMGASAILAMSCFCTATSIGAILAARAIFGAIPSFRPQIEAEWPLWAGILGAALAWAGATVSLARPVRSSFAIASTMIAFGAVLIAGLNLRDGLHTASQTQFGVGMQWWVTASLVVGAVAVPIAVVAIGVIRDVAPSRSISTFPWLCVAVTAAMGTVPGMFFSRFIKMFEFSAAVGGIGVAAAMVLLVHGVWQRQRKVRETVDMAAQRVPGAVISFAAVGLIVPIVTSAWMAAHFYAYAPTISTVLGVLAPVAGAATLLVLWRAPAWVRAVAGMAITGALCLGATVTARNANHREDDMYGAAGRVPIERGATNVPVLTRRIT